MRHLFMIVTVILLWTGVSLAASAWFVRFSSVGNGQQACQKSQRENAVPAFHGDSPDVMREDDARSKGLVLQLHAQRHRLRVVKRHPGHVDRGSKDRKPGQIGQIVG